MVLHLVSKAACTVEKTDQSRVDETVKLYKKEFYIAEQEFKLKSVQNVEETGRNFY